MSSFIQVLTGSLAGNTINGGFGSVMALHDSQITVVGSFGEQRFLLPKGEMFTDTGTWLVSNSITSVTAWTDANVIVQSA
jgi:hypothetical protein